MLFLQNLYWIYIAYPFKTIDIEYRESLMVSGRKTTSLFGLPGVFVRIKHTLFWCRSRQALTKIGMETILEREKVKPYG